MSLEEELREVRTEANVIIGTLKDVIAYSTKLSKEDLTELLKK